MSVKVTIDLTDTSGYADPIADRVIFRAKFTSGSPSVPGRVISTATASVDLQDGKGEVELEPGPTIITLRARNYDDSTFDVTVPETDDVLTLRDLLEGDFNYTPEVLGEAQQLLIDTRAASAESKKWRDQSEALYGDLDAVKRAKEAAEAAQAASETAQGNAQDAETAAKLQADRSRSEADRSRDEADRAQTQAGLANIERVAADDARDQAQAARGQALDAQTDAEAAQGAAEAAQGLSEAARGAAEAAQGLAETAKTDAETARTGAETARNTAESHRDQAKDYSDAAAQSEGVATNAATDAAQNVVDILDGHVTDAGAAATRSESAADRSETAAQQAETIGTGNLPDATQSTRGLMTMTGDLAGTGSAPRVPGLSLTAPGAQIDVRSTSPGWGNASAPAASNAGWVFDGEYLSAPNHFGRVHVLLDWCGRSSVSLRGRRRNDGTIVTIGTIAEGTPENHRSISLMVDLHAYSGLAAGATWTQEDIDAGCEVHLAVQVVPDGAYSVEDIQGLGGALDSKLDRTTTPTRLYGTNSGGNYAEVTYTSAATPLSVAYRDAGGRLRVGEPTAGEHATTKTYVDDVVATRATPAQVNARPAMWIWDGLGEWVAPDGAVATDTVLNLGSGELHTVEEVVGGE